MTTTALTLAGAWPSGSERPTVIELDSRGGDVAWRFGLASEPGLRSLAVASRLLPDPGLVTAHAQPVGMARVPVVVAPKERDAARHAVASLTLLLDVLGRAPEPVLVDFGEVDVKNPDTTALLAGVAALMVVVRAVPEQIARLQAASADLLHLQSGVKALLIGDVECREVAGLLGLPVVGVLPLIDPDAGRVARLAALRSRRAFEAAAVRLATELAACTESLGSERGAAYEPSEVS